ncbi:DNA helicase UvrD [Candidatus Pacearchaeota archaeon]|nr:DNA helicase UvrD [Candidatus Pacearchaeota archaeon]
MAENNPEPNQKRNWMIADLHIHSRFSRACSKKINIPNLAKWGKIKGLDLIGTGDFSHPIWIKELKETLVEKKDESGEGTGIYFYEKDNDRFKFIITGEISLIYTQGHGRKAHLVLLIPNIQTAEKINSYLDTKGRRDYDGRPIFKISCEEFTKDMMNISKDIEVIPAHIWTPYFGVFGSMSGFDSLKEAFGEQLENIHAIETGISSDPHMNAKISELKKIAIVSFSDSHSFWPYRLGREATIFKKSDSYKDIIKQIRERTFIGTIETDPAYGKYHFDGHRKCGFSCSPEKTKELKGICPKCRKSLTLGVDYRVEDLAHKHSESDEVAGKPLFDTKKYYTLLPLHEIISLHTGVGMQSKTVWKIYNDLIEKFGNEFNVLLDVSREEFIEKGVEPKLIGLILKNRSANIRVNPGYDGVYGEALVESTSENKEAISTSSQKTLF